MDRAHGAQYLVETLGDGHPYFFRYVFPGVSAGVGDPDELLSVPGELVGVQVADVAVVELDPVVGALEDVLGQTGVVETAVVAASVAGPGVVAVGSELRSQVRSPGRSAPSGQAFGVAGPWVRRRVGPEMQTVR